LEIIEGYRGKTTIGEMFEMNIGDIDYLYYRMYLKAQTEAGRKELQNRSLQYEMEDANLM
jgi:hypothetical protein